MNNNIDGIISRKLELIDYLKEKKPEIVCLAETIPCEEIQNNIENDNYNIWRKDRKDKKGGGMMLMIKSKMKVKNVEYEKGKAELISAQIKTRYGESQKNSTVLPPILHEIGLHCKPQILNSQNWNH